MPAASEPRLPHTFRPLGVRMAVYVFGALLVLVTGVVWLTFPDEIRDKFTTFQRGTVIVLGLGFLAIGWGLARCRIEARRDGLKVVNGYRVRRLEWSEVVAVTMRPGSPWAVLDLSDGTAAAALGIQASDGARARRQVLELRRMVEALTRTERDD
jgi:hypothetical protein